MPRTTALAALAAILLSFNATGDVLSVRQDGSGDFTEIQAAIDAAASGDQVEVGPGTFPERLTVSGKTLEIRSVAGKGEVTTIDA
ncbi:MAG: pectin esterase, partial [Phycisphaera sp.]|nr:pectin esterase [Phycisphaera sp.]